MTAYRCLLCDWITETDKRSCPSKCQRCGHLGVQALTTDQLADLLDSGEVVYCAACKCIHSGPVNMKETE